MRKRRANALGALLSASFLSCLFALLLVADQAFPPVLQREGGIGLREGIRGSPVLVGGPDHSAIGVPDLVPSSAPSALAAEPSLEAAVGAEAVGTAESGSGRTPQRSPRESETADGRTVRTPDTAEAKEKDTGEDEERKHPHGGPPGHGGTSPGHARGGGSSGAPAAGGPEGTGHGTVRTAGNPPGHRGTPPGHARGGGSSGAPAAGGPEGTGHGTVRTAGSPPGHGGTPPGHGGTPPGQSKVKDHGGKGRGKGQSTH
jgi:hypothetical protein